MTFPWFILGCSVAAIAGLAGGIAVCKIAQRTKAPYVYKLLRRHFAPAPLTTITVAERQFPATVRADIQRMIDQFFKAHCQIEHMCGIRSDESIYFGSSLSTFLSYSTTATAVALEYDEVNIGEPEPVRCLGNTLWLLAEGKHKHAVLMSKVINFHTMPKMRVAIASPNDADAAGFASRFFRELEESVRKAQSYRGKVLSFSGSDDYSGEETGITVHTVPVVRREDLVLPEPIIELLERNVVQFVRQRPALAAHGQSLRKGLLFHGAPGNGKTHTIHYLIGELKGHTTVVITAEQMGNLAQYMSLARLLQPSLVVLEDVDLIARDRMHGDSACQESLLNRLLNEMDGLAGDAEIIFLLTTNRPEALEEALAARPGRIDQAIEFGMPAEAERRKLARLYARSMDVSDAVLNLIVERTEGVSGAFIKELMRRALQFHLAKDTDGSIDAGDVDSALDELVMTGGRLNRRVLGFGEAGYGTRFDGVEGRQPTLRTRNPR